MFINFFLEVLPFMRECKQKLNKKTNVEKYSRARQAT